MRTVGCTYEFNVLEAGYAALWEPYVGKQRSSAMYASVWELLVGKMALSIVAGKPQLGALQLLTSPFGILPELTAVSITSNTFHMSHLVTVTKPMRRDGGRAECKTKLCHP